MKNNKTAIAAALSISLGIGTAATADAAIINASWTGLFTWLNASGTPLDNVSYPYYGDPTWGYGLRTQISGTFTYDTGTGAGSVVMNPFDFETSGPLGVHDFSILAVGDGAGGAGTLVMGKMLWDWNGNNNINTGIVLDAAGFFGAGPFAASTTISGVGATPASNGMINGKYPIGTAPIATTTLDTNYHNDPVCVMTASCLTGDDGVGGVPMDNGPFPGFNFDFDITSIHVDSVVPVPAAAWLFGSGLLGLLAVSRHKRLG